MLRPALAALASASALLLAWAGPAGAATYFVQKSLPGAADANQCTSQAAPCATIQGAVDKAKQAPGNTVHVVAPGDHHAPVDEYDSVTLDGAFPVTLTAPGVAIRATGGATGLTVSNASIINDVAVASATGPAVSSTSSGATFTGLQTQSTGAVGFVGTGKLARSNLIGFTAGLQLTSGSPQILNTIVRSGSAPPNNARGIALSAGVTATLRHVTVTGFPTQVHVGSPATLNAANSTFARPAGTADLALEGATSTANLTNTNVSDARTSLNGGQVTKTDPLDVNPGLASTGHLAPGSALIDRGTTGGPLAGDPADAKDVDGHPRNQGSAPDVGADETAPVPPPTQPPSTQPPVLPTSTPTPVPAAVAPAAPAPAVNPPIPPMVDTVPTKAKPKKKSKCKTKKINGKKKKVCPKKKRKRAKRR